MPIINRQDRMNYLNALEESLQRKYKELEEQQAAGIKFQHMQGTKDSIAKQKRLINSIKRELGIK